MQIREFHIDDYSQVVSLWQAAGLNIGRSDNMAGIRKLLERDSDLFLVAEENGHIVGVVMGSFDGRRGWINHLAIALDKQNSGLGSSLISQVEERLKTKGCIKINLLIEPTNALVQNFYLRLGYSRDALIFMEKWLD